jgi:uncharacterized hydrophobic protein (TIGR00271 family)
LNLNFLKGITEEEKNKAVEVLVLQSSPRSSFFFMVMMSVIMATLGLLLDSAAIVIGSMLVAPVLYPILSLSMGIIISDKKLMTRSFKTLTQSVLLGLAAAFITQIIFYTQQPEITAEIIKRTEPSLLNVAVAVIAGLAAAFALVEPQINEAIPGVAVSVSLVPPLAVSGIGLAKFNIGMLTSAYLLLAANIIGIMFSSMIVFSLMGFAYKKKKIKAEIKKDEQEIKKEEK